MFSEIGKNPYPPRQSAHQPYPQHGDCKGQPGLFTTRKTKLQGCPRLREEEISILKRRLKVMTLRHISTSLATDLHGRISCQVICLVGRNGAPCMFLTRWSPLGICQWPLASTPFAPLQCDAEAIPRRKPSALYVLLCYPPPPHKPPRGVSKQNEVAALHIEANSL